ncbi:TetR/AcrR family transcriptional regulator [Micromonospora sp. WMMD812]|uniref:TetR/AcrR family transcriptional regulator n=1 Tax=Micromonospora sp. WMMD812 TaxID=3015152 RepID=UPI00248B6D1D|nr:TetR/AcrR family transcriptional regulator [Micromonospora sp. WMMD812]WBB67937.1 TetR/AcrR family transcriptional regulator [Micromonospora sp. WMMD812]
MGHREQLLAGAKRSLYERGYARTTARDIVAASGTNLASIGYHFGSKEALLTAAMIEAMNDWGDTLQRRLEVDERLPPPDRLRALCDQVIAAIRDDRALWAASVDVFTQTDHQPDLRARIAAAYEAARPWFGALVAGGPDERSPQGQDTARAVGSLVLALISGLTVQWLLDPEHAPTGADLALAVRAVAEAGG